MLMGTTIEYPMDDDIEASRLEFQSRQAEYSLQGEFSGFSFEPGERVLDAGCGTGLLGRHLFNRFGARVDGVDASPLRVEQGIALLSQDERRGVRLSCGNVESLGSEYENVYDSVIGRYVMEYTTAPAEVVSHLRDALKPGGRLVLIDMDGVVINLSSASEELSHYLGILETESALDLRVGRKLPWLMHEASLENIEWRAELVEFQGDSLIQERENMQLRFSAAHGFLARLFGSEARVRDFVRLYLEEMMRPWNPLVYTKFICVGVRPA